MVLFRVRISFLKEQFLLRMHNSKKNVVSYSIFGEDDRYWGAVRGVVWAHHHLFPGWEIRFYHDDKIHAHGALLKKYAQAGFVNIVDCGATPPIGIGALWRFKAIWDLNTKYVLTRDVDSLPLTRDRLMVEEFMSTGCAVHTISDHPDQSWDMQAGMLGFQTQKFRNMVFFMSWESMVSKAGVFGVNMTVWEGGPDQQLLGRLVWPIVAQDACEHRLKGVTFRGGGPHFNEVKVVDLPDVLPAVQKGADELMPFMGCPGFDRGRVISFFKEHGDQDLIKRLEEAESK